MVLFVQLSLWSTEYSTSTRARAPSHPQSGLLLECLPACSVDEDNVGKSVALESRLARYLHTTARSTCTWTYRELFGLTSPVLRTR